MSSSTLASSGIDVFESHIHPLRSLSSFQSPLPIQKVLNDDAMTANATFSRASAPITLPDSNNPINPKVLMQMENKDPRMDCEQLQPVKTKQKLSLNEYLKRKRPTTMENTKTKNDIVINPLKSIEEDNILTDIDINASTVCASPSEFEPELKRARVKDSPIQCSQCSFTFKSAKELEIHKIVYCPEGIDSDSDEKVRFFFVAVFIILFNWFNNFQLNEQRLTISSPQPLPTLSPKLKDMANSANEVRK